MTVSPIPAGTGPSTRSTDRRLLPSTPRLVSKVRGKFDTSPAPSPSPRTAPVGAGRDRGRPINTGNDQRDGHVRPRTSSTPRTSRRPPSCPPDVEADGDDYVLTGDFTPQGRQRRASASASEFNGVNPGMGAGPIVGFEVTTVINCATSASTWKCRSKVAVVVGDKITHQPGDRGRQGRLIQRSTIPAGEVARRRHRPWAIKSDASAVIARVARLTRDWVGLTTGRR